MSALNNDAQKIVDCSNEMLDNARSGKWKKVAKAEELRRHLLNKLFSSTVANESVMEIDDTIHKIISINKKLEELACDAREKTRIDMKNIREGRLAVNEYAQFV